MADGRVIETTVTVDGDGVSAASSARSAGASSSSVSVSSGGSGSTASATGASTVDGVRRSTSVRRDATGCTITVDDRPLKE